MDNTPASHTVRIRVWSENKEEIDSFVRVLRSRSCSPLLGMDCRTEYCFCSIRAVKRYQHVFFWPIRRAFEYFVFSIKAYFRTTYPNDLQEIVGGGRNRIGLGGGRFGRGPRSTFPAALPAGIDAFTDKRIGCAFANISFSEKLQYWISQSPIYQVYVALAFFKPFEGRSPVQSRAVPKLAGIRFGLSTKRDCSLP